ncbi:TetR/AcrR family transcriptional regulator [Paenarthrobacter sp. NPDC089675]|uniref:TetR/AcrR family transcriptional regulator n=1 Tax=Paenarthrobacter sp. NPDC089675 TaxID=3364376 RepID=UPI00380FA3F5
MSKGPSTRETLLAAASELLKQGGPHAVTLRAVGAMSGVSRTTPYRHFEDKEDLLSAVGAENLVFIGEAMRSAANDATASDTPLERAAKGYIKAAMERPAHYLLVFGDFQFESPSAALESAASDCVDLLYQLVADAQREGTVDHGDVREIAAMIWAALHGIVDLTLSGHLREPRMVNGSDAAPRLVQLLLRGLAPATRN